MKKRKIGQRSGVLLDDVDIDILRILNKNRKLLSIGEVQSLLNMTHVSFKIHIKRLEKLKFIIRERVPKMFKFNLIITDEGINILKIFNRVMRK